MWEFEECVISLGLKVLGRSFILSLCYRIWTLCGSFNSPYLNLTSPTASWSMSKHSWKLYCMKTISFLGKLFTSCFSVVKDKENISSVHRNHWSVKGVCALSLPILTACNSFHGAANYSVTAASACVEANDQKLLPRPEFRCQITDLFPVASPSWVQSMFIWLCRLVCIKCIWLSDLCEWAWCQFCSFCSWLAYYNCLRLSAASKPISDKFPVVIERQIFWALVDLLKVEWVTSCCMCGMKFGLVICQKK